MNYGGALVLAMLIIAFLVPGAAAWMSYRVWKRRKEVGLATKVVAAIVAATFLFGFLPTAVGVVKAMGAVGGESIDPSQKARILAEGISEAMNGAAFGMLFVVPALIALFVVRRRERPTRGREEK